MGIRVLTSKQSDYTAFELDFSESEWFEEFRAEYVGTAEMLEELTDEEERELFEGLAREIYEGDRREEKDEV